MSFKKFAFAAALAAAATVAQATPVTWGVSASFGNGTTVAGTVDFDDATIQGFFDGYNDPNDTHIYGATFTLTSAALGWANQVFTGMTFQPYYYSSYGDGPHIDSVFYAGNGYIYLGDGGSAYDYNNSVSGSWAFDRNYTPVPATLPLMGLALAGLAFSRKQKAAK